MTDGKNIAPYAFEGLDRLFHEKARLGILASLISHQNGLGFRQLKELCGLTDGNLSRHMQILEEANMIELRKGYKGKRPHTNCRLTVEGRRRFSEYLSVLENVIRGANAKSVSSNEDGINDDINATLEISTLSTKPV